MAKKKIYETSAVKRGLEKDITGEYKDDLIDSIQKEAINVSHKCTFCNRSKPDSQFFINDNNSANNFRDYWCKTCVSNKIKTTSDLNRYLDENYRVMDEEIWDKCVYDAQKSLKINEPDHKDVLDYASTLYARAINKPNVKIPKPITRKKTEEVEEEFVLEKKVDPIYLENKNEGDSKVDDEDNTDHIDEIVNFLEESEKTYNADWNGYYTESEVAFLENSFLRYNSEFDLSDINMVQNAKSLIKVTLEHDKAMAKYNVAPTKENMSAVKEFSKLMLDLSNNGKFSAKTRTPNDFNNFSDLGSLIKAVEETGALIRKQEFDDDDVDFLKKELVRGNIQSMRDEKFLYEESDDH